MTTNREFLERISKLSPKRLALLAVELNAKLEKAEKQQPEPIAVIGMSCRFPGSSNSPEAYWEMMANGIDAITEIPADRYNVDDYYDPDHTTPGKMATRWGGYVDNIDQFDPQLFGIAPREAITIDPQQRMIMEVSWEALERAGYAPDSLDGYPGGVFVGICNSDYHEIVGDDLEKIDVYLATGSAHSVASGRLSYVLGLQGPAVTVDTACSSSLVSLHLAVQSLRNQECKMALAGGSNALITPRTTVTLSQANMMAADGRCKAFDDSADGFVRSEGCGMVVLKRLSDAQADGDQILAVIRGSAMNQDGRSNGLTAPNGPSQESVIRAALANGNLSPADVTFIETHGTGTALGDPIEVQALGAVYGPDHSDENPLLLGSVKTNIGHLESAAGIAGFMKLVLVLNKKKLPPHLHFEKPNHLIPWDDFPVVVPKDGMDLPTDGRLIGGVSSFGFSGTNVHIIAEAPPTPKPLPEQAERPWQLLTLSAKSQPALAQLSGKFADYFAAKPTTSLADAAYSANTGRADLPHRLAITADSLEAAQSALADFADGKTDKKLATYGRPKTTKRPLVVFLFTGQGAQYLDMGRQLYESEPIFKKAIDQCDAILQSFDGQPLLPVLYAEAEGTDANLINEIAYAQPSVFSIQYALVQLWQSWGIEPDVVLGHSNGEYAAAHTAGIFSLEDALKLVVTRGRLMQSLPPNGAMAAVFAGIDQVNEAISTAGVDVAIAGVNGPESTVISGEETAVSTVIAQLKQSKIRARRVAVSVGAHSSLMDPVLAEFEQTASGVTYHTPKIDFFSTVTNSFVTSEIASAAYWRNHMRQGVQFYPAMKQLFEAGYEVFLEIGPAPMLLGMGQRCNPPETAVWLPSLRPGHEDWRQLFRSLGELYTVGAPVDWAALDKNVKRQKLTLPTYPFQRERYWADYGEGKRPLSAGPLIGDSTGHPLLGQRLQSPALDDIVFETQLSETWPAFLAHHRVFDSIILPSPAFIEMVLAAAESVWGKQAYHIRNFTIQEALVLSEDWQRVQLLLTPESDHVAAFKIVSLQDGEWKTHVGGTLAWQESETTTAPQALDITAVQARCTEEITQDDFYQEVAELGLEFGPDFRGLNHIWRRDGEALGRVELPESLLNDAPAISDPSRLSGCLFPSGWGTYPNPIRRRFLAGGH